MSDDKIEREILLLEPLDNIQVEITHTSNKRHKQSCSNKKCGGEQPHFTQDLIRHINMRNFKFVVFFLVFLFIFYHGYLNSFYGRNSCNRLLGQGHIKGDNEWQPFGCMIHKYTKNNIQTCFRYVKYYSGRNSFVFIGDLRIRQVFLSFIKQFDESYELNGSSDESNSNDSKAKTTTTTTTSSSSSPNDPSHIFDSNLTNISYTNNILNFEARFIWKPMVDESLNNLIETYLQPSAKPSIIVLGMASAYLVQKNASREALESFKSNLTNLIDMVKSLDYDTKYPNANKRLYKINDKNANTGYKDSSFASSSQSTTIYWMLQDPIDEAKYYLNRTSQYESACLNNRQIDIYNRAAINLIYYSPIQIWSSSRLVSQAFNKDSPDGFHIGPYALEIDSQILFNLYCNNRMNFNDASCCSQPEQMSILQQIIFSFFIICISLSSVLFIYKLFCKNHSNFRLNISGSEISLAQSCKNAATSYGFYNLLITFTKVSLIMLYFFACDRANYFMKENRHFTYLTFLIPLVYVSVVGMFFQESLPFPKIMNRFQTDELKGFMQLVILLFRMSSAHKSIPLFLLSRLFTSAYLFLSGYGHFMYYWNTGNYSLVRFFQVLFRVNFLPILLCFSMNRMYQFYAFIPLVTFWFITSYILMLVYPHVSAKTAKDNPQHYFYMIVKFIIFGALITTLNMSEVLFEKIFIARPWKFLFVSSDDLITEWRQRWSIDRYAFLFGMSFALAICLLKRMNLVDEFESNAGASSLGSSEDILELRNGGGGSEKRSRCQLSLKAKFVFTLLSVAGLVFYYLFAVLCTAKETCDSYTTFVTVIPIISYFLLRNSLDCLRETYSYVFNWFGKISLELYLCSYHIWLAADSNGVLVLLPGYSVVNMLLTTFIFICVAHEINIDTRTLAVYLAPNNWRVCLRNFIAFLIILMPIAIKYGYI